MTGNLISLSEPVFWAVGLVAIVLMNAVWGELARRWVWAGVNAGFLVLILGSASLPLLAAVLVGFLLLRTVAGWRLVWPWAWLAAIGVVGFFLIHKWPPFEPLEITMRVKAVLATIGFSYVALRLLDLIRAVGERRHPVPGLSDTINYLLPFHMLAAGPIQSYDEFVGLNVQRKPLSAGEALGGVERIASGLFKKFVLAYFIQRAFLTDFESNGVYFFLEIQLFFLWLYLDFSAYSDIAVGVGKLMGVATPENFNRPYLARNVIDFWDRWHVSLSLWIRHNVFIPTQLFLARRTGGRYTLVTASFAFLLAFLIVGLWHGLTVNFLLWGLFHALGLITVNVYRTWLQVTFGQAFMKRYNANRVIRVVSSILTYQFVAVSLVLIFYTPWELMAR